MERDTIEIDLSTLLDELSAPDPPAPIEIVAGEMPPVMPVVPVVEDPPASPVAPVTAVEWTPVWLAPGRLWPPMKGVTVESAIIPQLAPPRAVASTVVPRTPRVQGKPIQDEWGFFDPARCGFAALLSKLDEITEGDERPVKHGA